MKKANFMTMACVLMVTLLGCNSQKSAIEEQQPNVIFIFPDQFRNSSLGIWSKSGYDQYLQGNPDPVNTPALDKMAAEGVVFSQAVSNFPLCSPYRAMMLSGMYPDTNGATNNCRKDRESSLRSDVTAITDVFAQGGYNVSYFGKCHWLKNEPLFDVNGTYHGTTDPPGGEYINRYDTYIPQGADRHSIDYFCQVLKDVHFDPLVYSNDPKVVEGKKDGELFYPKRFSAEFESEKIINYLDNTHNQRDTAKPFFMIWSLNPPHNPWTEESTKMEYFDQYTDHGEVNLDKLLTHENADHETGHYAPYYFANVSAVDHYIGLVLDKLEAMGVADNTIIVFSSDHGEMLGSHGKRGKNVPENESLNIPFVVKWGSKLKHRVEDLIMGAPDVLPTLVALAGMEDRIPAEVQGTNYADVIKSPKQNANKKPKAVLIMNSKTRGVFTGEYTFVVREDQNQASEIYCYDNKRDPNQLDRIAFEELSSAVSSELKSSLERLLKQTNDRWYQEKVASNFLSYN